MLRHGEWVGIFTAFDLILFQIDWLVSGVSVCLCNVFGLFCFFLKSIIASLKSIYMESYNICTSE